MSQFENLFLLCWLPPKNLQSSSQLHKKSRVGLDVLPHLFRQVILDSQFSSSGWRKSTAGVLAHTKSVLFGNNFWSLEKLQIKFSHYLYHPKTKSSKKLLRGTCWNLKGWCQTATSYNSNRKSSPNWLATSTIHHASKNFNLHKEKF